MAQSTPTTGNITNIWIQDANGKFVSASSTMSLSDILLILVIYLNRSASNDKSGACYCS